MIDLPIGTRFYSEDKLFEVAEAIKEKRSIVKIVFFYKVKEDEYDLCGKLVCSKYLRKNKILVCFKEVKE